MAIIDYLDEKTKWLEFYNYKVQGGHLSTKDTEDLKRFVDQEEYMPVVENIRTAQNFSIPKMKVLNKKNTNKKRTVFSYDSSENYVLKMISYSLLEYDTVFSPNLYSFRKNTGVKRAIADLTRRKDIDKMYSYKIDIHDYFNSIDIELLLPMLKTLWNKEAELYHFVENMLRNPFVDKDGEIVQVKKGIMAGTPIAPFLANVYLKEMDAYFKEKDILYARYSDDIILFADSEEEICSLVKVIDEFLERYHLQINPNKVKYTKPGEKWEFLGFGYQKGVIDVSDIALQKIKGKLKRKARAIYRWKRRNQKLDEYAVRAYIKYYTRKFFDNPVHNEITWCRWYFPIINTDKTLHLIDRYVQDCIRYLVTGKYTKANYNFRYEDMKRLGYRCLVNEFYKEE